MKLLKLLFLSCILLSCTANEKTAEPADPSSIYRTTAQSIYGSQSGVSEHYAIIVDYSIPSNQPRMFVWDYVQDKIVYSFWCAHGFGGGSTAEKPVFSNNQGSYCSSLGLFLIDKQLGTSASYGYRYHALDGLSATNSNARSREILLHPWGSVEADSVAQIKSPMACDLRSAGCFTMTPSGFRCISAIIRNEEKQILLYAIEGVE